jgi:MFS family permease
MAPKLGALSDRYGRKTFMIFSSCGLFITEIVTVLVYKYPDSFHYNWLLAGAVVDGASGSFTVGMALTNAYAADCTPPPRRAVAFGYFHACLFSGIAIGPLVAAYFIKAYGDLIIIFYVALTVHTFYIFFITFIVPESLSKKRQLLARERHTAKVERRNLSWNGYSWMWAVKKINILEPLKILWPTGPGTSGALRANLILLSSVDTIIFGIAMGAMSVLVYYLGYQFGWDTADTSVFISIVNTVRVFGLVACLPLFNYFFRTRRANRQRRESGFAVPERNSGSDKIDLYVIRFCIFLEIIGYLGYSLVRTGTLFTAFGIVASFGGIGSPTLQSALTKHVPHDRVGQLLGAIGLLHALARIASPIFFNLLYAATVDTFPQAVFVVLTGCFSVGFVVSWFVKPHSTKPSLSSSTKETNIFQYISKISTKRQATRNALRIPVPQLFWTKRLPGTDFF